LLDKQKKTAPGSVAVIGLGRFGTGVAKSLVALGHDVLAIEHDADTVQTLSDVLTPPMWKP
jgi:trk system potassium uptake protein TrkA